MAEITGDAEHSLEIEQEVQYYILRPSDHYGTILEGDQFFRIRSVNALWLTATDEQKINALTEATEIIDTLNFLGEKHDSEQYRQFPRGNDTVAPVKIRQATYLIAYKILEGFDQDMEIQSASVQKENFEGFGITYFGGKTPLHIQLGIPSYKAFTYLIPFLRRPDEIKIQRSS